MLKRPIAVATLILLGTLAFQDAADLGSQTTEARGVIEPEG